MEHVYDFYPDDYYGNEYEPLSIFYGNLITTYRSLDGWHPSAIFLRPFKFIIPRAFPSLIMRRNRAATQNTASGSEFHEGIGAICLSHGAQTRPEFPL